jgi:hypothetical protein
LFSKYTLETAGFDINWSVISELFIQKFIKGREKGEKRVKTPARFSYGVYENPVHPHHDNGNRHLHLYSGKWLLRRSSAKNCITSGVRLPALYFASIVFLNSVSKSICSFPYFNV